MSLSQSFHTKNQKVVRPIKAKRKEYQNHYHLKFLQSLGLKPGRIYTTNGIELLIMVSGRKPTNAGPLISFGVREGYLKRVDRGVYWTTKKLTRDN